MSQRPTLDDSTFEGLLAAAWVLQGQHEQEARKQGPAPNEMLAEPPETHVEPHCVSERDTPGLADEPDSSFAYLLEDNVSTSHWGRLLVLVVWGASPLPSGIGAATFEIGPQGFPSDPQLLPFPVLDRPPSQTSQGATRMSPRAALPERSADRIRLPRYLRLMASKRRRFISRKAIRHAMRRAL
jgi:hypothetical protein